jgi:alpha-D-xyloside xylohydrolase
VTDYKARSRRVYLPAGPRWYDFWSGMSVAGGETITGDAPYDALPLFVRAGSIIPVGPDEQYIGEKDASTVTLYVYTGANGQFSLYEDDGVTYGYERRARSRIPIAWSDTTRTLTIGQRIGSFPGMISTRTFNVVIVSGTARVGYAGTGVNGRSVSYNGSAVRVTF